MSFNSYYGIFESMYISITLLGHVECEVFQYYDLHKKNCTCEAVCDVSKYIEHKKHYTIARKEYQQLSKYTHADGEVYSSAYL